jgi:ATP-binding cassette subfamily B protein
MGMVAAERVMLVLDNQDELKDQPGADHFQIKGEIEFRQVGFSYQPGIPVLRGIHFSVQEGEMLAIVGHTGSGKSTIINLINRMYQHQEGEILIDGKSIEHYTLESLRSQIAVVLQDVFLFSGSILDNVTLRDPSIPLEKVVEAAKMIGIDSFIERLPGGYHYNVQERGATLSTGQRQLLSFLRALLFDPAILILDEATSSVDSNTEGLIQQAIEVLTKGRTSIVIAHRLSTIRKAHKIIVIEGGQLIEEGTHEALLTKQGSYAKMIDAQMKKDGD